MRLDGGVVCLDFTNTIHNRYALPVEDYIDTPERFYSWSAHAGAISRLEAHRIRAQREVPSDIVAEAAALRASLYVLFTSAIAGRALPKDDVATLDRWVHRAWRRVSVDPATPGGLCWANATADARLPLLRIALSALSLLTSPTLSQVKQCEDTAACGWLFLDCTKNQRRRWCSMVTCGTLAKMRRYRQTQAEEE
jgi:predicted RNA-binding Zn ribbon-like protein